MGNLKGIIILKNLFMKVFSMYHIVHFWVVY
jgi:hypothetical protein